MAGVCAVDLKVPTLLGVMMEMLGAAGVQLFQNYTHKNDIKRMLSMLKQTLKN